MALVHHSVLDEEVDLNSQPVYLPQKFNQGEINEINRVLNISQSSASSSSYYHQQKLGNDLTNTSNQDNNFGKGGIIAIVGTVSVLLIVGGVVIKKRLSRKIKR